MTYITYQKIEKRTPELELAQKYNITDLKSLGFKESDVTILTIDEMIKKYQEYSQQNEKYEKYISELQAPYTYFLKYLYLPSFNIWRDDFT